MSNSRLVSASHAKLDAQPNDSDAAIRDVCKTVADACVRGVAHQIRYRTTEYGRSFSGFACIINDKPCVIVASAVVIPYHARDEAALDSCLDFRQALELLLRDIPQQMRDDIDEAAAPENDEAPPC